MSTEKDREGSKLSETQAKLSPGESGKSCLMCGADIETMFVPGWSGNKFCRDCYYPPADAERRIAELKQILKADCIAWGGTEADKLHKRIAELETELHKVYSVANYWYDEARNKRSERDQLAEEHDRALLKRVEKLIYSRWQVGDYVNPMADAILNDFRREFGLEGK